MILIHALAISIFAFCAAAVAGAMGVIIALLFGPRDPYDEDLEDREQLEYIERWKHETRE